MKEKTKVILSIMAIVLIIVVQLLNITKAQAAPMPLDQEARCYISAIALDNEDNAKKHRLALRQYRKIENDAVTYNIGFALGFLTAVAQIYNIDPSVIAKDQYKKECEVES